MEKQRCIDKNWRYNHHGGRARPGQFALGLRVLLSWDINCHMDLSNDTKQSLNISMFKNRIKEWKGDECNCRLWKMFIANEGLLHRNCFIFIENSSENIVHIYTVKSCGASHKNRNRPKSI